MRYQIHMQKRKYDILVVWNLPLPAAWYILNCRSLLFFCRSVSELAGKYGKNVERQERQERQERSYHLSMVHTQVRLVNFHI
jgi:hypothetical protein